MRRRFDRRLWTLILSLLLLGGGSFSLPTYVSADSAPRDPVAPPPPDGGDPDWPTGPQNKSPRPGPARGAGNPTGDSYAARQGRMVLWMKWTFRVAFGSTYRIFFRY